MAVKKTTKTAKAATKDTKTVKTTKAEKKVDFVRILENHVYVILAIVVAAFILFTLGMAAGAAITIN